MVGGRDLLVERNRRASIVTVTRVCGARMQRHLRIRAVPKMAGGVFAGVLELGTAWPVHDVTPEPHRQPILSLKSGLSTPLASFCSTPPFVSLAHPLNFYHDALRLSERYQ